MTWTRPGRLGALLYAVAGLAVSAIVTIVSRLRWARRRGRFRAAQALPPGAVIIISNHASYADGVLLALVCRRLGRPVRLLATGGVFRAPVLGGLVRRLGFIPVERGSATASDSLATAAEALRSGEAVGIFPEGRTTRDPNQWPERAKTGAVRLALATGAPIVPIAMVGTHRLLPREHAVRFLIRNLVLRPKVLVEVGDPIDVMALASSSEPAPEELRRLADDVMASLVSLVADVRQETAPDPAGVEPAPDVKPSRW